MPIINSPPAIVRAKTERAAIRAGWGPTVRLVVVRVAPLVITLVSVDLTNRMH